VTEAAGNKAAVAKGFRGEACFGCPAGETCRAKPAPEAGVRTGGLLRQALAALLPLPAGFAAGFFLVPVFFPAAGEPARAAGGVLSLFATAAGYYLFRFMRGTQSTTPP
jgi:hypothetical protein